MKTLLFVIVTLFLTGRAEAQVLNNTIVFHVNESGLFKTSTDTNYYVIPFEGKSAHQLYNDFLGRIAKSYTSPENVTEKMVEDSILVVNAQVNELVEINSSIFECFDFYYRFEFNFKEGKVRVNAPEIVGGRIRMGTRLLKDATFYPNNFVLVWLIKEDKSQLPIVEKYLNEILTYIVYGNPDDDNW